MFNRAEANKQAASIHDITNKALASGGLERIAPDSRALARTGESKVPFSQGLVPRKATTMPKPRWHAPWKLMRVRHSSFDDLDLSDSTKARAGCYPSQKNLLESDLDSNPRFP